MGRYLLFLRSLKSFGILRTLKTFRGIGIFLGFYFFTIQKNCIFAVEKHVIIHIIIFK